MIDISNFSKLVIAIDVSFFGPTSPADLMTAAGILVEVLMMLILMVIANKTHY